MDQQVSEATCPLGEEVRKLSRNATILIRLYHTENRRCFGIGSKSKVRSQVKKSTQVELTCQFGGRELLDHFYSVFAINMRDLGTPVFPKKLFSKMLLAFEVASEVKSDESAEICVVFFNHQPVAAAILVHADGVTEIPSASCLRKFNRLNANMFMYWNLLQRSIERSSHTFDFGRSSEGSGTHKFKAQWGAQAFPAVWQYYVRQGDPADMRADGGHNKHLVKLWQRLPVALTKIVGPPIVRGIP